MATQVPNMSSSRYEKFRSPPLDNYADGMVNLGKIVDEDGFILYENENTELLLTIVKLDDIAALSRYLETNGPRMVFGPKSSPLDDPFWVAAAYGSTGALRLLLEHWDANGHSKGTDQSVLHTKDYKLLQTACDSAQVETVQLLLSERWKATFGNIHARDAYGSTAILAAASSLLDLAYPSERVNGDRNKYWIQRHLARAEKVMHLLLDGGACARDIVTTQNKPSDTVLSLAISRASPTLIKRLISEGAEVHEKVTWEKYDNRLPGGYVLHNIGDVTPFHIGSLYSNIQGLKILLDHARITGDVDMVHQLDSLGRLPLHWASWGPVGELCDTEASDFVSNITATIELLLEIDRNTVNVPDIQGNTALHYAIWGHRCYNSRHIAIPRALCEHGADASLHGHNGETPLHGLGFRVLDSQPVDTGLIDLLLEHGGSVGAMDREGNTPLHYAAKNLLHIEAARHLVSRGADISATNQQGSTPLHYAAGGTLSALGFQGRKQFTLGDRMLAQDEMINALLHRTSERDADALMDIPNLANSTPRQMREQSRNKWRKTEDERKEWLTGRGRGRGRGRGK